MRGLTSDKPTLHLSSVIGIDFCLISWNVPRLSHHEIIKGLQRLKNAGLSNPVNMQLEHAK